MPTDFVAIYVAALTASAATLQPAPVQPLSGYGSGPAVVVTPGADGVIRMAGTVLGADVIYVAAAADEDRWLWLTTRVVVDDRGSGAADALVELGAGPDLVRAGNGFDKLMLGCGDDVAHGGAGDDLIFAGCGNDVVYAGTGEDHVLGGRGADRLHGQDHADRLYGQEGPDRLTGGPGDDWLDGGKGTDRCNGGPGADTFIDCEIIEDFDPAEGDVDLSYLSDR